MTSAICYIFPLTPSLATPLPSCPLSPRFQPSPRLRLLSSPDNNLPLFARKSSKIVAKNLMLAKKLTEATKKKERSTKKKREKKEIKKNQTMNKSRNEAEKTAKDKENKKQ